MSDIQLQKVTIPSHLEWQTNPGGENNLRIEIYTGNVDVQFSGESTINQENFLTYLPLNNNNQIRKYDAPGPIKTIIAPILVSPIGIQAHEDQEFLGSVDGWNLQLRSQTFNGADSLVLILGFMLAVMNGVILRVGYHVTVTTPLSVGVQPLDITPTTAPHGP
jgi:hypothetical protein